MSLALGVGHVAVHWVALGLGHVHWVALGLGHVHWVALGLGHFALLPRSASLPSPVSAKGFSVSVGAGCWGKLDGE
jgi:hypothetical protein